MDHTHTPLATEPRLMNLPTERGWCDCGAELRLLDGTWHQVGAPLRPTEIADALRGRERL